MRREQERQQQYQMVPDRSMGRERDISPDRWIRLERPPHWESNEFNAQKKSAPSRPVPSPEPTESRAGREFDARKPMLPSQPIETPTP
jgi:hypothetical protein